MLRRTLVCALLAGCGAKSGLRDYRFAPDATVETDVPPVEPACRPLRVRTRVGVEVALSLGVDHARPEPSGYVWSLRQAPPRSRVELRTGGDATARITPDATGTYDIAITTPYRLSTGAALVCAATVLADPADPLCPEYALVEPVTIDLPGSTMQFAFESVWSTPRVNRDGPEGTGIVASDDPADDVAALVWELVAEGDLDATASTLEGRVASAVGAVPVLVGREGSTHDGLRFRRSSFRVTAQTTTAAVLRDRVARDVTGLNPGPYASGFSAQRSFVLEVTTVLRPDERRAVMLLAAAPEALFDDPARATTYRLQDVTNTSGLARQGERVDVVCNRDVASRTVTADFLWLVDTSGSMNDDQERLGNTAERFFQEMNAAGIDFRVGVMQAGSSASALDLDNPGFEWISGSDPMGPRRLAWQVTLSPFHDDPADTLSPYSLEGREEEPLAAGVVTAEAMLRREGADPTARRSFRRDVTRAAFFVTDEIGRDNDDARFFARDVARWGATPEARVRAVTQWYRDRGFQTFGMANLFTRAPCPNVENFVACVVVGNGGAYIPLNTALDAEVSAALSRIADSVAGAASEFVLDREPISSTLRVALDARLVPRSRADGFDWNHDARTLVFRGSTFRPRRGQAVRTAYFLWSPR